MDLKGDINLDDIKNKILAFADKKTLIKFGIGLGSVLVFLIIYYAIINPILKDKKAKLNDMMTKQAEIEEMDKVIIKSKAKIKKFTPAYKEHSTLFHSRKEVEGLYDTLSQYAGMNGLELKKIAKKQPIAVYKAGAKKKKTKDKKNKALIAYYNIPVTYVIKGNFLGFIKFKRDISKSKKMLNFDKESIAVIKGDTTGAINATGTLTIVGLPDDFN